MMMLLSSPTATPCSSTLSSPSHRILPSVVAVDQDDESSIPSHDVHPHDVLLLPSPSAHDDAAKKHAGNYHYKMLVRENLDRHRKLSANPRHQQLLCRSLVLAVRAQDPPGRFLVATPSPRRDGECDALSLRWVPVDDAQATEATGRMFEEEEARGHNTNTCGISWPGPH